MPEPDFTDAQFKVIRQPPRRWRITFDWRNFLFIAALAFAGLARWMQAHYS